MKEVITPFKTNLVLYSLRIQMIEEDSGSFNQTKIIAALLVFRSSLQRRFKALISDLQSHLLFGILLGVGCETPQNITQSLRYTGTIHVILSMFSIFIMIAGTLVSLCFYLLTRKLPLSSLCWRFVPIPFRKAVGRIMRAATMASLVSFV